MAAGDGCSLVGKVVGVSSLEQEGGLISRTAIVDLGKAGSISFGYTAAKDGGLAFVKLDDLVQVRLEVLGASKYDVG